MTTKTTAQQLDESRAKKNVSIQKLQTDLLYYSDLDRAEWKLAWAYGIMVVGFGLLGGLLLAVLTR